MKNKYQQLFNHCIGKQRSDFLTLGDINLIKACRKFKNEFHGTDLQKAEKLVSEYLDKLANSEQSVEIMKFSRDYSKEVLNAIREIPDDTNRATLFRNLLDDFSYKDIVYLKFFYKSLAETNDIKMMNVFYENWKL